MHRQRSTNSSLLSSSALLLVPIHQQYCCRLAFCFIAMALVISMLLFSALVLGSAESSFVKKTAEQKPFDRIPGLTHITLQGAFQDGNKEVETWLETVKPGSGTPIHRHDCEETFIILKGGGTVFIAPKSDNNFPGEPESEIFSFNSTFTIPPNAVHQILNTKDDDMHFIVVFSRPPIAPFVYKDWNTLHSDAVSMFPIIWDVPESDSIHEEL